MTTLYTTQLKCNRVFLKGAAADYIHYQLIMGLNLQFITDRLV